MTVRACCICGQPIERAPSRNVTCGHPRCVRTNRMVKSNTSARKRSTAAGPMPRHAREALQASPDHKQRARIGRLMRSMLDTGMSEADAVDRVAKVSGMSRAVVLSTWRAVR